MPGPYGGTYKRERARLLRSGALCWRCGRDASTADHVPPLAMHDHVARSGCCVLLAACARCNYRDGGRIGARRRGRAVRARRDAVIEASRAW